MTKKEFGIFAMALKTYFPAANLLPNEHAMSLWYKQLKDIPAIVAEAALEKWVAVNKWPPSIADIRESAVSVQQGERLLWSDGWEQTLKVIRKYGSYNAGAALAELDDVTRQTVRRLGYMDLCRSENIVADRANFRMIYEQISEQKKKAEQIPYTLTQLIEGVQQKGVTGVERERISSADTKD